MKKSILIGILFLLAISLVNASMNGVVFTPCIISSSFPYINISEYNSPLLHNLSNCSVSNIGLPDYGFTDNIEWSCYRPDHYRFIRVSKQWAVPIKLPSSFLSQINIWYLTNQSNCFSNYNFGKVTYHQKVLRGTHYY